MTTSAKFGRYEIRAEIGRGGMATVYHAYDPRFERDVAIKVLPREFLHDPQFRVRFEREAKTIALLEHPAIVPVYDFGEEEGQPYIVMRYMSGGSLADRLGRNPVPVDDAVKIIARLAPALDAAHKKGIVHRDLKPGNILFDQYGNAFLSDFGIARLTQTTSAATLTGGAILGTPAYMSPEQVQGSGEVDGRSDIYSLGVILYQMLTGNTPYQAENPAKVMMMHLLEPVPNILEKRSDLPPAMETVVENAMAKNPDERFPSTVEMATAAEQAITGKLEKITLPPIGQVEPGATVVKPAATVASSGAGVSTATQPAIGATVVKPLPAPGAARRFPTWLLIIGGLLGISLIGALVLGGFFFLRPTATPTPLPTFTLQVVVAVDFTDTPEPPSPTPPPPTDTLAPTEAPTLTATQETLPSDTPTALPVTSVGGGDKIAFFSDNNVWVANLDGSDLNQLTDDGGEKTNLRWMPDGSALYYISGLCVKSVTLAEARIDNMACFEYVASLNFFEISPDGGQLAIGLNSEMYLVPFDQEALSQVRLWSDIKEMAPCEYMAPYVSATGTAYAVKQANWSNDMQSMAMIVKGVDQGKQVDLVRIIDISRCVQNPHRIDEFPANRFVISGYNDYPIFQNFGWDGQWLFAIVAYIRNEGFGDLYTYNMDLHRGERVNPINNTCCYRDPSFSPDGSYLAFAFQDVNQGAESTSQLYYVPFASLGTGLQYMPILLPDDLLTDPKESPQPVIRPIIP